MRKVKTAVVAKLAAAAPLSSSQDDPAVYLQKRRRALIKELREIEELLGMKPWESVLRPSRRDR